MKNQFEGTGFEKFATVKIETMKAVLQSEKIQELITDIGLHAEDFIGIESENNELTFKVSNNPILELQVTDRGKK